MMNKSKPKHPSAAVLARLSTRELEVAQMILRGYDDRQIGARLCITRDTVQSCKRKIRLKLGLPPRVPIAKAWVDLLPGRSPWGLFNCPTQYPIKNH